MLARANLLRAAAFSLFLCLGTWAAGRALDAPGPSPTPLDMRAGWISSGSAESSVAQFRKDLILSSSVRTAWIAVAAREGYEVVINGIAVGRSTLWRPTRPFQTGLSERGQRVAPAEAMLHLSFPREYQWESHDSARLPVFFDIAPFLLPGQNAICVEVETRAPPARLALEGEIVLWSGEVIALESDRSFKAAPAPPLGSRLWTERDFADHAWPSATPVDEPRGERVRVVDPRVYREPFAGRWLRAPVVLDGAAWFETSWHLDAVPEEAWIRVLVNRPFTLFINDRPVRATNAGPASADAGEWIIGRRASVDAPATAESLDPDEIGTLFIDQRSEGPAGPLESGRLAPAGFDWEQVLRGSKGDDPEALVDNPKPFNEPKVTSQSPDLSSFALAEQVAPKELARAREHAVFYAYGIQQLLAAGDNHVAIRLSEPDGPSRPIWAPKLAVDGGASGVGRSEHARWTEWTAHGQTRQGAPTETVAVIHGGWASAPGTLLPRMQYRGMAERSVSAFTLVQRACLAALGMAALALFLRVLRWARARRLGEPVPSLLEPLTPRAFDEMLWILALPMALFTAALLVAIAWGERDEALVFLGPSAWRLIVGLAMLSGALVAAWVALPTRRPRFAMGEWIRELPSRRRWPIAVASILALGAVLRIHGMQVQPLDDDELASTQAILAIAHTGVPRYSDDVYYTRGPLYHYITAGSVRVLGESLTALRIPSVLFATATALLLYLAGARLLRSKWTGLLAAFFYAIHPYAIFVGHLVRFYQQQQFFALATAYCFCRGFVTEQRQSARYLTLAALAAACLSQELSMVMIPPLVVAVLLFAKKQDRGSTLSMAIAGGCVAVLLVVDILVFQTRCLTKLEGISPNVEATMALHFMSPLNFITPFISYSRLHLVMTAILLAALSPMLRLGTPNNRALLLLLFGGIVSTNLLVTGESIRYQYWFLPLFLLLAVHGISALVAGMPTGAAPDPLREVARRFVVPLAGALALTATLLSLSPWRIPGSYASTILGDSASAFGYVRAHVRPGDKVAATEPHTHAGLLEVGRIDYDLAVPLLHDFVYRKDGHLVDRNGGAAVVASLEQLQDVVAKTDRLWVLVNREKFRSRGQDIRWEYPAARIEQFLRQNFEVKYQSYLWTVFLWDGANGRFHSLPASASLSWQSGN